MNYYELRARDCLKSAIFFGILALALIVAAFLIGPSWLSLLLAVVGVQGLNIAASEMADRRRYLNRTHR